MNFRQKLLITIKVVSSLAIINIAPYINANQLQTNNTLNNPDINITDFLSKAEDWSRQAQQALAENQHEKAIKALENSLWYDPKNKKNWIKLYRSYRYVKQTKYALNSLKKASEYFPDEAYFWTEKTKIYIELHQFDDATRTIERILELTPDDVEAHLFLGYILYEQKFYDKALISIQKAKQLDDNYALLYLLNGNIYAKQQKFNEAIKEYTAGIKLMPSPSLYLERAKVYYQQNQLEASLEDLQNALAMEPFNYEAWDYKGRIYYMLGKYYEALEAFNTSLAIDTKAYNEWDKVNNFFYYKERYQEIVKLYNILTKEDPNNPEIWNNKAGTLLRLHLEKEVINRLEKHNSLDPDQAQTIHSSIEEAIQTKNLIANMENYAKNALKLNPNNPKSWFYQGFIFYYKLDFEKAAEAFEKSISLGLETQNVYYYLSKAYESMGMFNDAEKMFKTSLQIDSYNAQTWYEYAVFLNKADRYAQALQTLNKGLEINRHLAFMWSLQGEIYLKLGYAEKALDSFEQALVYQPTSKIYLEQLGRSYSALGFFNDAIKVFDTVLKNNPEYIPASVSKGKAYFEQGKYQQALDMFNKALKLDNNNLDIMLEQAKTLLKIDENMDNTFEIINNILEYNLGNHKAWLLKGITHYTMGDYDEAQNAFQNSVEIMNKEKDTLNPNATINTEINNEQSKILYYKSLIAFDTKDYKNSLELINNALKFQESNIPFLKHKIRILQQLGHHSDEIASIEEQIKKIFISNYDKQKELRKNLAIKIMNRY